MNNLLRVIDELLWSLRRSGLSITTAQAIEVAKIIRLTGFADKELLKDCLLTALVTKRSDQKLFSLAFDDFFKLDSAHARDIFGKLRRQGVDDKALEKLQQLLEAKLLVDARPDDLALWALLKGGADLTALLGNTSVQRGLSGLSSELQVGFFNQRTLDRIGYRAATKRLDRLRAELADVLGETQAEQIVELLRNELMLAKNEIRAFVESELRKRRHADPNATSTGRVAFFQLSESQRADVRRAVKTLGERLKGAARIKERHHQHGHINGPSTMRQAMRTAGVPIRIIKRRPRRNRPKLWVLCDVSDSVRFAASFLLEFVAVVQELFERTRTFVFVSEIGETTQLFENEPTDRVLEKIASGAVVNSHHNSNYGRAFRQFEEHYLKQIDRRCTVVILGDGRTNYQPPEADCLGRIRERARAVLWLCPESKAQWGHGDSAMPLYSERVTHVLMASNADELESAARAILATRLE